jgi:hypothetical protein
MQISRYLQFRQSAGIGKLSTKRKGVDCMDYILRDIGRELWSKAKEKATLERKTMREVIFESLKWYIKPAEIATSSEKKKKGKKSD